MRSLMLSQSPCWTLWRLTMILLWCWTMATVICRAQQKCYTEKLGDKATKGILMESHTDDLLAILHDVEASVEGGNVSNAMVKLPLLACHMWRIQS